MNHTLTHMLHLVLFILLAPLLVAYVLLDILVIAPGGDR